MSDELEARYRRLLSWYPWEHRRVYEEEMLAVLMAGARPGQRYPGPADSANIMFSAVRCRLGMAVRSLADDSWRDAAAVVGVVAAILMLGLRLHAITGALGVAWRPGMESSIYLWQWVGAVAWAVVVAAALGGLRRTAAVAAWAALLLEMMVFAAIYGSEPVAVVSAFGWFVLAVVAAGALTVPNPPRRAVALLGPRRLLLVGFAVLVAQVASAVNAATQIVFGWPSNGYSILGRPVTSVVAVLYLTGGAIVVGSVWRVDGPVRRRIVVLLAPVVTTFMAFQVGFGGWRASSPRFANPVLLVPAQWAVLVLVPLFTFAIGVLVVGRMDETQRLIALGRAAEKASE